jgi:hypothetical protein
MIVRQRARAIIAASVMVMVAALMPPSPAAASTAMAPGDDATFSVLHAIPAGLGADVIDVYAGRALIIDDLTPGALKTVKLPGGAAMRSPSFRTAGRRAVPPRSCARHRSRFRPVPT